MMWFFAILVVLVMGGVAMVAAGRGQPMSEAYDDRPDALVPREGDLTGRDLRRVRFPLAVRGYRMAEVDALLDRLAVQLESAHTEAAPAPVEDDPTDDAVDDAATDVVVDDGAVRGPRGDAHDG